MPEIQSTFNLLTGRVKDIYGRSLQIDVWEEVDLNSKIGGNRRISCGASYKDGVPSVKFFLTPLRQTFLEMRAHKPNNFLQIFEAHTIISLLHEITHLSHGPVMMNPVSPAEFICVETIVWAKTCEDVIRLFAELYGYELWFTDLAYYQAWQNCGKNPDSQQWRNYIAGIYGYVRNGG